jgi:hypothetical protein
MSWCRPYGRKVRRGGHNPVRLHEMAQAKTSWRRPDSCKRFCLQSTTRSSITAGQNGLPEYGCASWCRPDCCTSWCLPAQAGACQSCARFALAQALQLQKFRLQSTTRSSITAGQNGPPEYACASCADQAAAQAGACLNKLVPARAVHALLSSITAGQNGLPEYGCTRWCRPDCCTS